MLLQADASQLEWRCLVWLAQDPVGIREILAKDDIHANNQRAWNLAPGDEGRLIAKIFLFRTIYRGSGWAFANDPQFMHVSTDPKFWDEMNRKFYAKYQGIERLHTRWAQLVTSRQPITGPTGRQWDVLMKKVTKKDRFTGQERVEEQIPWTVLTNYPVQGTSADIMAVARVIIFNRMRKENIRGVLTSTVHDSIVLDIEDDELHRAARLLYGAFDDLPANFIKLFKVDMNIPFSCECKFGPNMAEMKKILPKDLNNEICN